MLNKKRKFGFCLLFCLLFHGANYAQSVDSLKTNIDAIQQRLQQSPLSEEEQSKIKTQLEHAQSSLNDSAAAKNQQQQYEQIASTIDEKLTKLQKQQQQQQNDDEAVYVVPNNEVVTLDTLTRPKNTK